MIEFLRSANFESWGLALILALTLFPRLIWKKDTGEYRGFLNLETVAHIVLFAGYLHLVVFHRETSEQRWLEFMIVNVLVLIIASRVTVELWHRKKFGTWLIKSDNSSNSKD